VSANNPEKGVGRYDNPMSGVEMNRLNQGQILQYMRFYYSGCITSFDFVDLGKNLTAIIGKNGSGKTTYLKEMAQSLLPAMQIEVAEKLWSGGFVFQPMGPRDGIHAITIEGAKFAGTDHGRYESGYGLDAETVNNYLEQDAVLPDRTDFALKLQKSSIRWEPKWDSELERELSTQNLFLKIQHQWPQYSFYDALESPYITDELVLRIVKINEDTPRATELRAEIIHFLDVYQEKFKNPKKFSYEDPKSGEQREYESHAGLDEFIHMSYVGESTYEKISDTEYKKTEIAKPLFENPLATPFLLGMNLLTDNFSITTMAKDLAENLPSTLIEWPREGFQGPRREIFSTIADVHLSGGYFKNDWERLQASISSNLSIPFTVKKYEHESTVELRKEIVKTAAEILKEWGVVPTWETTYVYADEKRVIKFGFEIEFYEYNISYSNFSENFSNETTKRWMLRALQIASIIRESDNATPYKLAFWDEPELGLHPTAIENVKYKVFPFLEKHGIKLVFSTHSLVLASGAQSIHKSSWSSRQGYPSYPVLTEMPFVSDELLSDIGFTKSDLLASIKTLLIVEGKHDKIVLETYFGEDFLGKERVRISTLDGANNLMLMPEAELIMDFLAAKVVVITDGGNKSRMGGTQDQILKELNQSLSNNDRKSAQTILQQLRSKVVNQSEGDKLLSLVDSLILRSKKDSKLLPRFSIHLLERDDIIHYLDPKLVLAPYQGLNQWSKLIGEWKQHKASEKAKNVPFKDRMNEKSYYKKVLGAKLSTSNVQTAANALLDFGPISEFEELRMVLKGYGDIESVDQIT
jgi:hypothetical protein